MSGIAGVRCEKNNNCICTSIEVKWPVDSV